MASPTPGTRTLPATTSATSPATGRTPLGCPTTTTGCSTRARSPGCTSTKRTTISSAWRSSRTRRRSCSTITGGTRPGTGLAASLSWPASKVSKLENGRQTPTDDDILAWTGATGASAEAEGLLASLHTLELQYAEWQRVLRPGLGPVQRELADVEEKTKLFRVFEASVVPGLLQTGEYARARFMEAARL